MSGAGFHLDLHRCVGCAACVLACRIENGRTDTAAWRRVLPLNLARRPGGPTYSLSVACHHCDNPACLSGCPANAYEKRPDGIVVHHDDRCIGCRYCEMTCPFGTPQFDADRGVVSKCHLCAHRVDAGLEPACVVACPTGALRSWGIRDRDDTGARPDDHAHVDDLARSVRLKPDATKDPVDERADTRAVAHERADPNRRGVRLQPEATETQARPEPDATKDPVDERADTRAVAHDRADAHTVRRFVPGFIDPAGCVPNLRFTVPAGARRAALYRSLEEALTR